MNKSKTITLRIDEELLQQMDRWLERQRIQVSRSALIEASIREFLRSEEKQQEK